MECCNGDANKDKVGTVMDIHNYIMDDVIHVDKAEKQNQFKSYFMSQISMTSDII